MPKMTGHRYFAEAMKGYGVSHLFYVNTVIPPAMVEVSKIGATQLVIAHGEKAAAYMADGYARGVKQTRRVPVSGHRQHQSCCWRT